MENVKYDNVDLIISIPPSNTQSVVPGYRLVTTTNLTGALVLRYTPREQRLNISTSE